MRTDEGKRATLDWHPFVPPAVVMGGCELHGVQLHRLCHNNSGLFAALKTSALKKDRKLSITHIQPKTIHPRLHNTNSCSDMRNPKGNESIALRHAHYSFDYHRVASPQNYPGVLAHELGHALQSKRFFMKSIMVPTSIMGSHLSMGALMLSPLYFILPDDDLKSLSYLTCYLQLPTLFVEINASAKGCKLLSDTIRKAPNLQYLESSMASRLVLLASPFVGVPSYVARAILPYLTIQALKDSNFYDYAREEYCNLKKQGYL